MDVLIREERPEDRAAVYEVNRQAFETYSQSSRRSPGTLENSRVLWLTRVAPRARAIAAIRRSLGPIGVPDFSRRLRISP